LDYYNEMPEVSKVRKRKVLFSTQFKSMTPSSVQFYEGSRPGPIMAEVCRSQLQSQPERKREGRWARVPQSLLRPCPNDLRTSP
jgi:hypothetical protein